MRIELHERQQDVKTCHKNVNKQQSNKVNVPHQTGKHAQALQVHT